MGHRSLTGHSSHRGLPGLQMELVDLEDLSDEELAKIETQFRQLRQKAEEDETQVSRHARPELR